jgi:nucleoside-diphosphate-sugar epimerase
VIHSAGIAHAKNGNNSDNEQYRQVNVGGTEGLAVQAAKAGIKRFIFISSVKVNGEGVLRPYTEKDQPDPKDIYGISKLQAEDALSRIAAETGLQTVILRPPLVYGAGVKANFKQLIELVNRRLPLPFGGLNNRRSFLYVGNLADAISACIQHPLASGETFLLSDGQDVSTSGLIRMIASGMGRRVVLFSLPPVILKILFRIAGKAETVEKLSGTFLVDASKIRNLLGWKAPFTMEEGLKHFLQESNEKDS